MFFAVPSFSSLQLITTTNFFLSVNIECWRPNNETKFYFFASSNEAEKQKRTTEERKKNKINFCNWFFSLFRRWLSVFIYHRRRRCRLRCWNVFKLLAHVFVVGSLNCCSKFSFPFRSLSVLCAQTVSSLCFSFSAYNFIVNISRAFITAHLIIFVLLLDSSHSSFHIRFSFAFHFHCLTLRLFLHIFYFFLFFIFIFVAFFSLVLVYIFCSVSVILSLFSSSLCFFFFASLLFCWLRGMDRPHVISQLHFSFRFVFLFSLLLLFFRRFVGLSLYLFIRASLVLVPLVMALCSCIWFQQNFRLLHFQFRFVFCFVFPRSSFCVCFVNDSNMISASADQCSQLRTGCR